MADHVRSRRDIDSGYAWVIFIGCFVMNLLVIGTQKCYGVLYADMLDYFQASAGETSWIGSLSFALSFAAGPFANLLCLRFSFRTVTFVGGVLIGVGIVTTALVPSVSIIYLTFGVIAGIGYGLCDAPCFTILPLYFERRRALATGVVAAGGPCGFVIFLYLYRYLVETYGFRGAYFLLGGVMLNVCCAACCFRQPAVLVDLEKTRTRFQLNEPRQELERGAGRGDNSLQKTKQGCSRWIPDYKLFKQLKFTMFCLGISLAFMGYSSCTVLIPVYVKQLGHSNAHANAAMTIYGVSEFAGRIVFGVLVNRLSLTPSKVLMVMLIIGAPLVLITPFLPYFTYAAIFSAIVGLCPGLTLALHPLITIEATGLDDFSQGIGLLSFCLGVGLLVSHRVLGWTRDLTDSWDAAFMFSAVLMLLAAACFSLPHILKGNATSRNPKQPSEAPAIEVAINEPVALQIQNHM